MLIKHFTLGQMESNCYLLGSEPPDGCLLVDVGDQPAPLLDFLSGQNLHLRAIVLTHGHYDHIAGLKKLLESHPQAQVIFGKGAEEVARNPLKNFSAFFFHPFSIKEVDRLIAEPESLQIVGLDLQILDLPGHSPGSIGLYDPQENTIYGGDVLFANSIGRTDFPGSSQKQLLQSIRDKIMPLPDQTTVWPGHGPCTTVGFERLNNPFLNGES